MAEDAAQDNDIVYGLIQGVRARFEGTEALQHAPQLLTQLHDKVPHAEIATSNTLLEFVSLLLSIHVSRFTGWGQMAAIASKDLIIGLDTQTDNGVTLHQCKLQLLRHPGIVDILEGDVKNDAEDARAAWATMVKRMAQQCLQEMLQNRVSAI